MPAGEGKSPTKCIMKIATALACPLNSVGTEVIMAIPIGPVPENKNNCAVPIPAKKALKLFRETPMIPVTQPKVVKISSNLQATSVLLCS